MDKEVDETKPLYGDMKQMLRLGPTINQYPRNLEFTELRRAETGIALQPLQHHPTALYIIIYPHHHCQQTSDIPPTSHAMLRACRRTVQVAIRSSHSPHHQRAISRSAPALLPRQISSIVVPSGAPPPHDGEPINGSFISNRPRQSRSTRGAKSGSSGSGGGPPPNLPPPPPKQPALPSDFAETYLTTPTASGPVTPQIRALRNLLLTSFSPALQKGSVDPTLAIFCPLEGGEHVIRDALSNAAGLVGADVVRLEAVECLGLRQFGGLGEGEKMKGRIRSDVDSLADDATLISWRMSTSFSQPRSPCRT
jgi:hypothetical protein